MSAEIALKVITPRGVFLSKPVISLQAPTVDGEIGILPLHARYCAPLKSGSVSYKELQGEAKSFEISGGFIYIDHNQMTLLVENN